jgi:mono/diheme cytochrome c family protein
MNSAAKASERGMKPLAACLLLLAISLPAQAFAAGKADGARLYTENCSYCHGAKGKGDGPNAAKLTPKPTDLSKSRAAVERIASVVRDGQRSCPSWKNSLDEDQIAAVAAYAHSLQE